MRAAIYAAKSTEDRHGSIPTQLEDCRALAEREGWEVIGEHSDEAFSAFHGNRGPGLAAAIAQAITHAPCVLVAQDSDRFARGDADGQEAARHVAELYWQLRRQRVQMWSVRSGKLSGVTAAVEGDRSHDETDRKSQATSAGIGRVKARGGTFGGCPLGYRPDPQVIDGQVLHRRAVDPAGAAIVRAIFDTLAKGHSHGATARQMNRAGHRTVRGREFNSRAIRDIAVNAELYAGRGPYPQIVEPDLAARVKASRRQHANLNLGGRQPLAEFMLRHLVFCERCGSPMHSITRRRGRDGQLGLVRRYQCAAVVQNRGTCSAPFVPAELAEERVLEHLTQWVGDVDHWIGEQVARRSDAAVQRERHLADLTVQLGVLDRQREQRMAELQAVGITALGLEVIERIDQERLSRQRDIDDARAALAEWNAELDSDAITVFYQGLVDLVQGRVARARGVAEVNAALHESLTGIWLAFDGQTLTAQVRLRPTEDPDLDVVAAELFGTLRPEPAWLQLPDGQPTSTTSRGR